MINVCMIMMLLIDGQTDLGNLLIYTDRLKFSPGHLLGKAPTCPPISVSSLFLLLLCQSQMCVTRGFWICDGQQDIAFDNYVHCH